MALPGRRTVHTGALAAAQAWQRRYRVAYEAHYRSVLSRAGDLRARLEQPSTACSRRLRPRRSASSSNATRSSPRRRSTRLSRRSGACSKPRSTAPSTATPCCARTARPPWHSPPRSAGRVACGTACGTASVQKQTARRLLGARPPRRAKPAWQASGTPDALAQLEAPYANERRLWPRLFTTDHTTFQQ